MGTFYSLFGSVEVENRPEVDEIIERIQHLAGDIEYEGIYVDIEENEDDGLTLTFGGSQAMSYESASELDDTILELRPYTTQPAYLNYECDGETGELYVGPPDMKDNFVSERALQRMKDDLHLLTREDMNRLVESILDFQHG